MHRLLNIIKSAPRFFTPRLIVDPENDQLFRAIYDASPIGIAIMDLQGRFVRANPAFQRMIELTEAELRAETNQSLTHPDDYPKNLVLLQELLDGRKKSFTLIKRYLTGRGKEISIRNTVSIMNDENGLPRHFVVRSENITENVRTQGLLRESESRFNLLVASITDYAIYMLDPEGHVMSWNAGAEIIKGYREDEIIGQHFSRFYPDEDVRKGKPTQNLHTAAKEGRFEDECWRIRKDGSTFWANVIIAPMQDKTGKLCGYAKVTRDLTARRRLEEQLQESEARLQAFLRHSSALIFMKDPSGRYLNANPKFLQCFGFSENQILGKTDNDLFPAEQAETFNANDRNVLERGLPIEFQESAQYVDGTHISIVYKFPVRNPAGEIIGIGGIATDITELKHTKDALHVSETSFRELLEILPIAVCICDQDGLIERYNRSAAELWGREPACGDSTERFCGSHRIYTPDGVILPHADCPMGQVLRTGSPVLDHEILVERPDGSRRTAIVNVIPRFDEHKFMTGAIGCLTDISDRKKYEHEQKEYTAQLRALSRRIVNMHEEYRLALSRELHDRIGQNLTALNINLDIVHSQLPDTVNSGAAHRLKDSKALVKATVDSITDVMSELRPPLLDDYGLLPALKSIANQFAQRTGVDVAVGGPDQFERLDRKIEISLCRVTQEALNNIAKHAGAKHAKIEITLSPGLFALTIADDGVGFDIESPSKVGKNKGWGLSTMRERAEAVGGAMMIQSVRGLGTQVTVTISREIIHEH